MISLSSTSICFLSVPICPALPYDAGFVEKYKLQKNKNNCYILKRNEIFS